MSLEKLKKAWSERPQTTIDYENLDHLRWNNELLLAVKAFMATSQTQETATAAAETPSNDGLSGPRMEHSIRIPGPEHEPVHTADPAASKSDTADTSEPEPSRLAAARKAAAARGPKSPAKKTRQPAAPTAASPETSKP